MYVIYNVVFLYKTNKTYLWNWYVCKYNIYSCHEYIYGLSIFVFNFVIFRPHIAEVIIRLWKKRISTKMSPGTESPMLLLPYGQISYLQF